MDAHNHPTDCEPSRMTWLVDRLAMLLRSMPSDRQEELTSNLTDGNWDPIIHAEEKKTSHQTFRPGRRDSQDG